jgi:hypothetical protein
LPRRAPLEIRVYMPQSPCGRADQAPDQLRTRPISTCTKLDFG